MFFILEGTVLNHTNFVDVIMESINPKPFTIQPELIFAKKCTSSYINSSASLFKLDYQLSFRHGLPCLYL